MAKGIKELGIEENYVREAELADEALKAISLFAPNKNVYRHIPFMCDGLLPSERRSLYSMWKEVKAYPWANYKKLALAIGTAITYHPHGETNIYNTMVKLAQPWKNACVFIDGEGSYGNELGDEAAAFRYLEARLSEFAYKCYFEEFSEDLVDMKPGFIEGKYEPEYLPAKYPVALTKACKAIGYGMYSEYPNYNFKELCEFAIKLMDNPKYDQIIYPDIPNGCEIIDDGQFDEIRRTGGASNMNKSVPGSKFRTKSKVEIDYEKNIIKILSVPMGTNLQVITKKIIELGKSGQLVGFSDIHNKNDKRSKKKKKNAGKHAKLSIDIVFKPGSDLDKNLELLYSKAGLIGSCSYVLELVDEYRVKHYTVRTFLLDWIAFRRDIKRRQINKLITKKMERCHILDTLIFITNEKNGTKTVEIASKSKDDEEVQIKLMKTFGVSSLQAKSISKMRVTAFNKASHESYVKERDELENEVKKLKLKSKSSKLIDEIIKGELREGISLFAQPRKSDVVEYGVSNYVADTNHKIVITKSNRIKKLSDKEKTIGYLEDGDKGKEIITANNRDSILVFDRKGNMSNIPVNDISSTPIDCGGVDISNLINVGGNVVSLFVKPDEIINDNETYIVLTTKNGLSKKMGYKTFKKVKGTVSAIKLSDDDELVSVDVLYGKKDLVVYTQLGGAVRISTDDVRECGRAAFGLKVIELGEGDSVVGTTVINKNDKYLLVVTNKGKMKKCTLSTFKTMKRKSSALQLSRLGKGEKIVSAKSVKDKDKFMIYTHKIEKELQVKDVPELTRMHECKKMIPVPNGDGVIEVVIR